MRIPGDNKTTPQSEFFFDVTLGDGSIGFQSITVGSMQARDQSNSFMFSLPLPLAFKFTAVPTEQLYVQFVFFDNNSNKHEELF